jgi:hypothetical protein
MSIEDLQREWNYYKYSDQWRFIKSLAMIRANYRCECDKDNDEWRCVNTTHLEMHHDVYPKRIDEDCVGNVRILCRECHEAFHEANSDIPFALMRDGYASFYEVAKRIERGEFACDHDIGMTDEEVDDVIALFEVKK